MRETCPVTTEQQKTSAYCATKIGTVFLGYPLDVVRSRMWVIGASFPVAFQTIATTEGVLGFYQRGFISALLKIGGREVYRGYGYEHFGHGNKSALFNATFDTLTIPFDKFKVLQQNAGIPQSFWQCIKSVAEHGLLKECYKGASFYWCKQLTAHVMTVNFQKISDHTLKETFYKDEETLPFWAGFLGSIAAGCAVATITNPLNMALTNSQAKLNHPQTPIQILLDVAKQQGIKGLIRGSVPSYVFAILGQASYYTAKTWCQRIEDKAQQRATERQL